MGRKTHPPRAPTRKKVDCGHGERPDVVEVRERALLLDGAACFCACGSTKSGEHLVRVTGGVGRSETAKAPTKSNAFIAIVFQHFSTPRDTKVGELRGCILSFFFFGPSLVVKKILWLDILQREWEERERKERVSLLHSQLSLNTHATYVVEHALRVQVLE